MAFCRVAGLRGVEKVLFLTGAVLGSEIPDLLEPPLRPNHWGFFHSPVFALWLGIWLDRFLAERRWLKAGRAFGCLSHLILDWLSSVKN